jgi:hypothetical protein
MFLVQIVTRSGADECWPGHTAANRAAPYSDWLAAEIQEAIDGSRPNLSHDEVMAENGH